MLKIYTDAGFRKKQGSACAFVVFENGKQVFSKGRFLGGTTNNVAEYQGLLDGLMWAYENEKTGVHFFSDSMLVVNQVDGLWKINSSTLFDLCLRARALVMHGRHLLKWLRGHDGDPGNEAADALVNLIFEENAAETREMKELICEGK